MCRSHSCSTPLVSKRTGSKLGLYDGPLRGSTGLSYRPTGGKNTFGLFRLSGPPGRPTRDPQIGVELGSCFGTLLQGILSPAHLPFRHSCPPSELIVSAPRRTDGVHSSSSSEGSGPRRWEDPRRGPERRAAGALRSLGDACDEPIVAAHVAPKLGERFSTFRGTKNPTRVADGTKTAPTAPLPASSRLRSRKSPLNCYERPDT